ncbi:GntR family transcriptional regulator [Novosphingobium sp. KCTC 2891]|uniref:FadR/GntR family transcriptional regulator n=1 Tax=Novosphingobium sp. KCTC 2891 TaxID=2989730 RepID=UPI0022227E41|nr:GntR family transcriptional regulator [Novosphingobium sp. KCTC 2891]MCW1384683.1 GntR family transcriptional regulator [Novosphingobium sp. KCTC 2891]
MSEEQDTDAPHAIPPRTGVRPRGRKRSEQVAHQIVTDIVRENKGRGAKLPLESELLEQYDVSRSSLREALRLLEVQGLITIRPGPGSGTEVGAPEPGNLSNTLALYLMMARASLRQLFDAWRMVEPILAQLAAENHDRERVRALMGPFASDAVLDDRALASGLAFHDAVAELAENPVLALILGAVGFLVTEQVRIGAIGFELSSATVHAHTTIADAILAGDSARAAAEMRLHLDEVMVEIETALPDQDRDILLQR